MTLDDVKAQRTRVFCKDRVTVGVAGAFPEGFDKTLAQDLAQLPACAGARPGLPEPQKHHGLRVLIVDKPSADSTAISIGFPTTMTRAERRLARRVFLHELRRASSPVGGRSLQPTARSARAQLRRLRVLRIFRARRLVALHAPERSAPRADDLDLDSPREASERSLRAARRASLLEQILEEGIGDPEIVRFRTFLSRYTAVEQQTESRRLGFALDDKTYRITTPTSSACETRGARSTRRSSPRS